MTPRTFLVLAGATAVGLVAALSATIVQSRIGADVQLYDEPMFPRLVERANDASKITYRTATETAVIELKDGVWRNSGKYGYPVSAGNIRSVIASIAALRKLEPKTDQPNRYASLAVEGITAEMARSRELIIEAADGTLLASVVLGRASNTMTFDPLGGMYVRVPGNPRAWLVRGTVALPPSAVDWMERQIVHVPGPDIKTLQIKENGQIVLNTEKETDQSGVVRYQLVPRDERIQAADSAVKQVASAIVSLQFEDVRPGSMLQFPDNARELIFTTFGGMTLTAQVADIDGKTWARFKATAAPGAADTERTRQIAAATDGWLFQMPGFKVPAFTRAIAELTEPKQQPGQGPGLPGGMGLPPNLLPGGIGRPGLALPPPPVPGGR
ncbi:MAG: DUF4340 domain-containing protein [Alphaproteobacteria bacterium]|nr:DUF4340 domain-containing protein [Alphaproteobacteria bacterium]